MQVYGTSLVPRLRCSEKKYGLCFYKGLSNAAVCRLFVSAELSCPVRDGDQGSLPDRNEIFLELLYASAAE
jgi:hypothetical protein